MYVKVLESTSEQLESELDTSQPDRARALTSAITATINTETTCCILY